MKICGGDGVYFRANSLISGKLGRIDLVLAGFSLDMQLMVKGAVVLISVVLGALLSRKRK